MAGQTVSKQFIFNEKIDGESLFSLYADDFPYMEEIFHTTLLHFDQDLEAIKLAHADADIADLKRAVHKIKPTFGFVGMTSVESLCREFEHLCEHAAGTENVADAYRELTRALADAKQVMESEYKRLKEFNANPI